MTTKFSLKFFTALSVTLFSFFSVTVVAQKDTLYYNTDWKTTVKDSAAYFRLPVSKVGNLYKMEDFYISGKPQMSGFSTRPDKDVWEGKVTWYKEDGSVFQQANYKNNRLEGKYVSTLDGKKLTAQFENGKMVSGKTNGKLNSTRQYYSEMRGDTLVNIIYQNDINGVRFERYSIGKKFDVLVKYFGLDGELLGTREYGEDGAYIGIEVFYYKTPMRPMEIKYYTKGKKLGSTFYYCKDQVREEFNSENGLSKTFYSPDGEILGKINYSLNNSYDYLKPMDGLEYTFYSSYSEYKAELIKGIREYSAGKLVKEELFYENQQLKAITSYKDGGKELQVSYNEDGDEIERMEYDNWAPQTGTEIIGNKEITYADGALVEEIEYYYNTKILFSKKTKTEQTFYDKDGSVLGTLYFEDDNGYSRLTNGDRYFIDFDGDIKSIENYKNGYVTKRISYRKRQIGQEEKVRFKKVEFFEPDGYKRTKEIRYYSNGNKQSEITFDNYLETTGIFYDEQGKVIGEYDYKTKEGILYQFFGDSDELKQMEKRENGQQLLLKRYDYGLYSEFGAINPVLVEDIDTNCCASFYSREGELLGKITFKDKKPWEGLLYDVKQRESFTFSQGMRNGSYKKYDYDGSILGEGNFKDDKKEGLFTYYDYKEQLVKTENYNNGLLDGKAKYYDKDQGLIGEMTYKDGVPINGTRVTSDFFAKNPITESYEAGMLVQRISYDDNGKRVSNYVDGKETETVAYHGDTDKKRLTYSVKGTNLDGLVIRYDKEGREQFRSLFEDGKLKEGTVMLTSGNIRGNPEYMILTRKPDTLSVKLMGKNEKVLFSAEENLAFGTATVFMQGLDIYMDYLGPKRLY